MATILSSAILADRPQVDGRRYVTEEHLDDQGETTRVTYLALANADVQAAATARQATILDQLRAAEVAANIAKALNAELMFTFRYSTVAENEVALRAVFQTATRWELLTIGWVLDQLNLSDARIRSLFGVAQSGVAAIRAKLADIAAKYEAALATEGI